MVIKPTYPLGPTDPIFGARLDDAAVETLAATIRAAPGPLRGAAPRPAVDGAGDRGGRAAAAAGGAAHLRRRRRRPTAIRRCRARWGWWAGSASRHLDRARRAQQGHLGHQRRRGQRVLAAAPDGGAGRADPRRRRSAEPRGRQLLLAGPLRRAGRGDRAPRAHHLPAARRAARCAVAGRRSGAAGRLAARSDHGGVGDRAGGVAAAGRGGRVRTGSCARRSSTSRSRDR